MVRWLAFLFWLFSCSTWKAFFDRLLREPRSHHGAEEQVSSSTNPALLSEEDLIDAALEHGSILSDMAKVLLQISSKGAVCIHFDTDKEYEHEALACDKDAYVERILAAITTSTTLKELVLFDVYPIPCDRVLKSLLSNKSVKKLQIYSRSCPGILDFNDWIYGEISELLMQDTCIEDVTFSYQILYNKSAVSISNMLRHNRTLKCLGLEQIRLDEEGWKVFLDPLSGGTGSNYVLKHLSLNLTVGCKFGVHTCQMVQIGSMLRSNTSLLFLSIDVRGDGAICAISSIGEALHFNMHLSRLVIYVFDEKIARDG